MSDDEGESMIALVAALKNSIGSNVVCDYANSAWINGFNHEISAQWADRVQLGGTAFVLAIILASCGWPT